MKPGFTISPPRSTTRPRARQRHMREPFGFGVFAPVLVKCRNLQNCLPRADYPNRGRGRGNASPHVEPVAQHDAQRQARQQHVGAGQGARPSSRYTAMARSMSILSSNSGSAGRTPFRASTVTLPTRSMSFLRSMNDKPRDKTNMPSASIGNCDTGPGSQKLLANLEAARCSRNQGEGR